MKNLNILKKIGFVILFCLLHQTLKAQNEFISVWQSTNAYPSVTIPTHNAEIYNYTVDWGDGTIENNIAGDTNHLYAAIGNYTVTITGVFPGINFSKIYEPINLYNATGILSIEQWGNNQWKTMHGAFKGQISLVINANDTPDLSQCTNMSEMFYKCYDIDDGTSNTWNAWNTSTITNMSSLFYDVNFSKTISNWDVSNVTNMFEMFYRSNFNQPISNWNVSSVTNMGYMFYGAHSFNQPIGNWNVSSVTNMSNMFAFTNFNQTIDNWNVSKVTDMSEMFSNTSYNLFISNWNVGSVSNMYRMFFRNRFFNQPIGIWNVSSVTNFEQMLLGCEVFNQPLNNWNVGNAINMPGMFAATSDFNQDLSNWNVSNVTDMSSMFEGADLFNQPLNNWNVSSVTNMSAMLASTNFNLPLDNWDVSTVTDMSEMFRNTLFFNQDIGNWDTSKVTTMENMFRTTRLFNQNLNNWDVSNVTNMASMFNHAEVFNQPLNNWDVSSVTDMGNMFNGNSSFNQNIGNWVVSNVTNMFGMFAIARSFNHPLNNWNVSNVTNMGSMFSSASLFNHSLQNWNVGNVSNMREMFSGATSFNQPLNDWNVSNVTTMLSMFERASSFNQPLNNWNVGNVTSMSNMFERATLFNYPLNNWNVSKVTFLYQMFKDAVAFDQNIGSWNVEAATVCTNMFEGAKLSNANYEALLIGWSAQDLQPNVSFNAGNSTYFSNEAEAAKLNMINNESWTIYDGGKQQIFTWTGAVSTDWNTAGNWDTNSVPTATDDVILADVANAPRINFNQNHAVNDLTVNENLTIKTNAGLTVNGDLDQGANIQVESFVNGNGSFILRGNQTNINPADLIYWRYVSGNNWHLFSSPVTGIDIDVFAAAKPLAEGQNNNRGLGFYDNNANPNWSYYQDGANGTGDFISGKGYSIQTSAAAFLILTGKLKSTDLSNYVISENLNGWNLVGNPYPANINANVNADANENFLTENADNLDPAFASIYLWNPSTTSYEPIGNGLGAKYIAPGQGFFVKSKNGGGTIDINKTMLTHQIGNLFLKGNQPKKIVLKIDDKTYVSETTIAFKTGLTNGLDVTYDAAVFSGESKALSLYTHLLENNENVPFAIQFLPELENNEFVIPLGIKQNGVSEITLSLKETSLISDKKIYLEDKLENTFIQISNNANYKFNHQKEAPETGRFFLHFREKSLNIDDNSISNINIYKGKNDTIHINGISDGLLNIYSITGQRIIENYKLKNQSEKVHLPKLSKGIYLINVKNKGINFTKKILF